MELDDLLKNIKTENAKKSVAGKFLGAVILVFIIGLSNMFMGSLEPLTYVAVMQWVQFIGGIVITIIAVIGFSVLGEDDG